MGTLEVVIKWLRSGIRDSALRTVVSSQFALLTVNCSNTALSKSVPCSACGVCRTPQYRLQGAAKALVGKEILSVRYIL